MGFVTVIVLTENEVVVDPAGTVAEDGTRAHLTELEMLTLAPPGGAKPLSVIVPLAVAGPATLFGSNANPTTDAGRIETDAVFVELPNKAVKVALVVDATPLV